MIGRMCETVAFERPGGEGGAAGSRPIDLAHLSRQTMGDRTLEQEILALFAQQLSKTGEEMACADATERYRLAHTLKGSARGVGAFALGDCAAAIEADPADPALVERLALLIAQTQDFIAAINR